MNVTKYIHLLKVRTCLTFITELLIATVSAQGLDEQDSISQRQSDIFELGKITVTGKINPQSFDNVSASAMNRDNTTDVAQALKTLPGLTEVNVGPRNEANIYIRGFNSLQATMYLDGVPVYVPYDGNIDLARFTTFDLAQITVEKGAVSPLYGANTMGGTINIITKKPVSPLDISFKTGLKSGGGYLGAATAGTRIGNFYGLGSFSMLNQESFMLSDAFTPSNFQTSDKRDNAYQNDWKASVKVGYEDSLTGEFTVSFASQNGKKGTPVYAGTDSASAISARFWKWPYYNKTNIYTISKILLGNFGYLRIPLYYDKFENSLFAYDNSKYTTQKKRSSFRSWYDDFSLGGSVELVSGSIPNDSFKVAVNYKNDYHKESNTSNDTSKIQGVERLIDKPDIGYRDYTIGIALENSLNLFNRLTLVPGGSVNIRKSLLAQNLAEPRSYQYEVSDFSLEKNTGWNAQLAVYFNLNKANTINASVSQRSRFPSIKERYSYRLGSAVPNPALKSEYALQGEIGYTGKPFKNLYIQLTGWDAELDDVIQSVSNVGPNKESQNQNTGEARFYGYEAGIRYLLFENIPGVDRFSVSFTRSYTKRKNISNPSLIFTDVPELKSAVSITYSPVKWVDLSWNNEWNGIRYSTSDGKRVSEAYSIDDIRAMITWHTFTLNTGINNILDVNYSLLEGYPEPGRNYYLNVSYEFYSKGE